MRYIGIDWASRSHEACVLDDAGEVVDRFSLAHTEQGIQRALARLGRLGAPADLAVAIERPDGVLVARLVGAGHSVYPIHPNAFAAARPRWGAAGAKDDPGDAYRLADMLRTDRRRLRPLVPTSQATLELQALSRLRDDQVTARVGTTNRLRALLDAHWPGAGQVFGRLDSEIALDFLERYPTPESAAHLGEARLGAFLTRHSYCGHRSAGELLGRLRAAPAAPTRLSAEVLTELVRAQVRLLRALVAGIADLDRALVASLPEHDRAPLLETLPRVGRINLAQIVGEIGPLLEHAPDAEVVAAAAGAAPVTRASGERRGVAFRFACSGPARKALMTFADNSRRASPWAQDTYQRARARGKRHPHAIRILARAWLRVIWAVWHGEQPYDPGRHGGLQRLLTAEGLT
jgi:transposase